MERARAAALVALVVALSVSGAVVAAPAPLEGIVPAAVSWPPSTGLLLAEVQTGGASASDEFVEVTNASDADVDLAGLEVAYVTSSGGTITRKASWPASLIVAPGRHLLIANASGIFAAIADATYSGGFAATGGALVLRAVGGAPLDAVAWGDATNVFVEDTAVSAPSAGSSIERRPGGAAGNTVDTNSNSADWFVQVSPDPQNLAAPPAPVPSPSTTPVPTGTPTPSETTIPSETVPPTEAPTEPPAPTGTPAPSGGAGPTPEPSPTSGPVESVDPTVEPTPTAVPAPTPVPTPTPSPAPSPPPSISPQPSPTSEPSPEPTLAPSPPPAPTDSPPISIPIAAARLEADGTSATVSGVLTTALGALELGREAFIQDASGGIAIYLDVAATDPLPAGTVVLVTGTLDDRYAERTLRASLAQVVVLGVDALPFAVSMTTGGLTEASEGLRVELEGVTVGSPVAMADGLGILVDDGTGAARVIVGADALGETTLPAGSHVRVAGPLGQRDSSGTGLAGYRVYATLAGELVVVPAPTPSPTPDTTPSPLPSTPRPDPSPTATAGPSPTPTATPGPSATPAGTPQAVAIATARGASVGSTVTVAGVVTAEGGRLGTPPLIAIADPTGGVVVRVPDGVPSPGRGTTVEVTGVLADPYGQLEIRPTAASFRATGTGVLPAPILVTASGLGEGTEGRLVEIVGTARTTPTKSTSGDLAIDLVDSAGRTFRAAVDASSGVTSASIPLDRALRLTGVVGQHASRKGLLDGYRVWLREPGDIVLVSGAGAPTRATSVVTVAQAIAAPDGSVLTVEAVVTAGPLLLDSTGRRIVVQDASAGMEVLLPGGSPAPAVGARVRVTGTKVHAWGAPRLGATAVTVIGFGPAPNPAACSRSLGERDEWRLVRLAGTVVRVERMGDRWRAELRLPNGDRIPILGQAGAGIPSTMIVVDRAATIVGIVKRPYPTASDRRFALLPRGRADVAIGPGASEPGHPGADPEAPGGDGAAGDGSGQGVAADITPDTDLATIFEHVGAEVRVGGLVTELRADGVLLDDGTAVGRLVLEGDALPLLPHIRVGDAVAARGTVRQEGEELWIVVPSASGLVRVGDLGQPIPIASEPAATGQPSAGGAPMALSGTSGLLPAGLSIATFGLVTIGSLLVTLLRRRAATRHSRMVVLARLASLSRSR